MHSDTCLTKPFLASGGVSKRFVLQEASVIDRRSTIRLAIAAALTPSAAFAQTVPQLRIGGKITSGSGISLDRAALENMGMTSFETQTPWYTSKAKFEGVPLAKLLQSVGAAGDKLMVTALNDYTTEIPVSDLAKFDVILAVKRDGQYMPVSDKGPFFIIYNFDSNPELKSKVYYSRSAWQVASIDVR
jgi:hypothetical protein